MACNLVAVWIMFALLFSASPAEPTIFVKHWEPMDYPPLSRFARIEGTVSITANLQLKEHSPDYQAVTGKVQGHPMLAEAAVANLKKWAFACYECKTPEDKTFHVIYEFRFDEKCIESECFERSTTFRSGRVLVLTSAPEVVTTDSKSMK